MRQWQTISESSLKSSGNVDEVLDTQEKPLSRENFRCTDVMMKYARKKNLIPGYEYTRDYQNLTQFRE